MATGSGRKPRRRGVKRKRTWKNSFFLQTGCRFIRSGRHFAWNRFLRVALFIFTVSMTNFVENPPRESISAQLGRNATRAGNSRQIAPIMRQSLARCFGHNFGPNFNRRDFPENLHSVPLEVVGCFPCILPYRFLQRSPGDLLSSFLPRVIFVSLRTLYAENQFEPGSYAVLLLWCWGVSLLATKTPVLRRSNCVRHAVVKPREHGGALDALSSFF